MYLEILWPNGEVNIYVNLKSINKAIKGEVMTECDRLTV